jgi:hypothetical protein
MLPSKTCWSTEVAVWELGRFISAPELGDGCTVHPLSTRIAKTFFLQEITHGRHPERGISRSIFWILAQGRTC